MHSSKRVQTQNNKNTESTIYSRKHDGVVKGNSQVTGGRAFPWKEKKVSVVKLFVCTMHSRAHLPALKGKKVLVINPIEREIVRVSSCVLKESTV